MTYQEKQHNDLVVVVEDINDLLILREAYDLSNFLGIGCRVVCLNDIEAECLSKYTGELISMSDKHVRVDWLRPSDNVVKSLSQYIHLHQIGHVALSNSTATKNQTLRSTFIQCLIRETNNLQYHIISNQLDSKPPSIMPYLQSRFGNLSYVGYVWSVGLVLLVSLVGQSLRPFIDPTNIVMIYLVAVVIISIRFGHGPSLLAATLSAPAFNLFFVPPLFDVDFSDLEYLPTFSGLLFAGLVISTLASRSKEQADRAKQRESETVSLYALTHELGFASGLEDTIDIAKKHIGRTFDCRVELVLKDNTIDLATLQSQLHIHDDFASDSTIIVNPTDHYIQLLKLNSKIVGYIKLYRENNPIMIHPQNRRLFDILLNQIIQTYERIKLLEKSRHTELLAQRERLHLTILNSVSHDLRTPLASITGTLSSMLEYRDAYDVETYREMLINAWSESKRLNRLVTNLLDMSRLKAGTMHFALDYCDVQDLIGATLTHMESRLGDRVISVEIPDEMILVPMDFTLMERVLSNLLDNSVKYTADNLPIDIVVKPHPDNVHIIVKDYGPGIPETALESVFEAFVRARPRGETDGTGLGLSICKEIIALHRGEISLQNDREGGLTVTIVLPISQQESEHCS